jgi:hypothetical protein
VWSIAAVDFPCCFGWQQCGFNRREDVFAFHSAYKAILLMLYFQCKSAKMLLQ